MRRLAILLHLLVLFVLFEERVARAQEHPVFVVAVAPGAREVDAARLRVAIGLELQATVVPPDDPRAIAARGRIYVSVDRAAGQLVVAYDGGAEPLVRRVALPTDPDSTSLAVVLLAGNLARDEAADLAAQLRKSRMVAPPPPSPEEARGAQDDAILRRMLSAYAAEDRRTRVTAAWAELAIGVGAVATGGAWFVADHGLSRWPLLVASVGVPFVFFGAVGLTTPTPSEQLSDYYSSNSEDGRPSWLRPTVEERWKKDAVKAHQARVGLLVAVLGLAAIEVATGSHFLARDWHNPSNLAPDIGNMAAGIGFGAWGLASSLSVSPVEQRLHDYERAVGRPIVLKDVSLRLAPTPGGLTVGLGGRF